MMLLTTAFAIMATTSAICSQKNAQPPVEKKAIPSGVIEIDDEAALLEEETEALEVGEIVFDDEAETEEEF
ncbi:MAG TPA: hypothetical protein VLE89_00290 [Chlamydiales bacterium]|nr:hypothetical protein [Chlamydiales bacterium]